MSNSSEIILGIDFGTTYASAGALVHGKVQLVLDRGETTIPTVVHFPPRGAPIVGAAAQSKLISSPATTVSSIKRILGLSFARPEVRLLDANVGYQIMPGPDAKTILKIGRDVYACEQIVAYILAHIRELAEKRFGARVQKAIIAMPVEASPEFERALRSAARIAHLEILQVIPEAIAGGLSLGLGNAPCDRRIAVCDFGGGTFDATLIEQAGLYFTPIACHGDSQLGGNDFDEILVNEIISSVYQRSGFDMRNNVVRLGELSARCESAKRVLSQAMSIRLAMKDAYIENHQFRSIDVVLQRSWAESKWQPLIALMVDVLSRLLEVAGWTASDPDEVVLIGGTSLVPAVRKSIAEFFGRREVTTSDLATVAVAYGATLQTAAHAGISGSLPSLTQGPISNLG